MNTSQADKATRGQGNKGAPARAPSRLPTSHFPLPTSRPGSILIALIIALVILQVVVVGVVYLSARTQNLSKLRLESAQAQYACESGMAMALYELYNGTDADTDGVVASISDDSNSGTDPVINGCPVHVSKSVSGLLYTLTAVASSTSTSRKETLTYRIVWPTQPAAFFRDVSNSKVQCSFRDTVAYTWSTPADSGATHQAPTWIVAKSTRLGGGDFIVGSQAKDGYLQVGLADVATGVATYSTVTTDVGQGDSPCQRAFDIGIENITGRALLVYYDNNGAFKKLRYCTYNGSLSAAADTGIATTNVDWVTCTSRPDSNEILVMFLDDNKTVQCSTWNGSSFSAATILKNPVDDFKFECYAGAYQSVSENPIVVYPNNNNNVYYRVYSGGAWGAETLLGTLTNKPRWIHLAARPGTNEVFCAMQSDDKKTSYTRWSGSAWDAVATNPTATAQKDRRMFDIACSPDGTQTVFIYDNSASNFYYRNYSAGAWSAEIAGPSTGSKVFVAALNPGPGDAGIIGAVANDANALYCFRWNGSNFVNVLQVKLDMAAKDQVQRFWVDPGYAPFRIQSFTQVAP